jgi:hypothetical protein
MRVIFKVFFLYVKRESISLSQSFFNQLGKLKTSISQLPSRATVPLCMLTSPKLVDEKHDNLELFANCIKETN